jgi:hypothetical protein
MGGGAVSWTLRTDADGIKVWRCSLYTDLNYAEINNFAEYGCPFSPYEKGFAGASILISRMS